MIEKKNDRRKKEEWQKEEGGVTGRRRRNARNRSRIERKKKEEWQKEEGGMTYTETNKVSIVHMYSNMYNFVHGCAKTNSGRRNSTVCGTFVKVV